MNRTLKVFWFDTETTGLDYRQHDIIELACIIEIEGKIIEEKIWKPRPDRFDNISEQSLKINKTTVEELQSRELTQLQMIEQLNEFVSKYINAKSRYDFLTPAGHNVTFDVNFLSQLYFRYNKENEYNSFFDYHNLDTSFFGISAHYLNRNWKNAHYGLGSTCESFGITFNENDLHSAITDVKLSRQLFRKAIGLDE